MTPSDRLMRALSGEPVDQPAWIPIVGWYAAEIQHRTAQEAASDPTVLHNLLRDAQHLFRADAHVIPMDEALIAAAAGAALSWAGPAGRPVSIGSPWADGGLPVAPPAADSQPGIAVMLEVQRRLRATDRAVALAAFVPGPGRLAAVLAGEDVAERAEAGDADAQDALDLASQLLAALVRSIGETGIDCLLVDEPAIGRSSLLVDAWSPIPNLARYYGNSIIVIEADPTMAGEAHRLGRELGIDALIVPAGFAAETATGPVLGIGVGGELLDGQRNPASLVADLELTSRPLISSLGPVPAGVRVEALKTFADSLVDQDGRPSGDGHTARSAARGSGDG
jgi:hypothetical protein